MRVHVYPLWMYSSYFRSDEDLDHYESSFIDDEAIEESEDEVPLAVDRKGKGKASQPSAINRAAKKEQVVELADSDDEEMEDATHKLAEPVGAYLFM